MKAPGEFSDLKVNNAADRDLPLMLKTRPLCTGAESNLRDRVLGEVEKNSFIALPGKGGHGWALCPQKLCVPILEDLVRSFIAVVQG